MTMNVLNTIVDISKKNMHLLILAIYAYVLFQIEDSDYITMILLTVAACLSICYLKKDTLKEGFQCYGDPEEFTPEGFKTKEGFEAPAATPEIQEGFENPPQVVRQMPDIMGPYDGLCLQTGNRENWMKKPDETALVPNDALFTYLSSQGPTKPVFTDNSSLTGPPVDGHPDSDKKMFMLANNHCRTYFSVHT